MHYVQNLSYFSSSAYLSVFMTAFCCILAAVTVQQACLTDIMPSGACVLNDVCLCSLHCHEGTFALVLGRLRL